MNGIIGLIIAFFTLTVFTLIAQFFDIGYQYYAPYLLWIIAFNKTGPDNSLLAIDG